MVLWVMFMIWRCKLYINEDKKRKLNEDNNAY